MATTYLSTQDYFLTQEKFDLVKTEIAGVFKTVPQPSDLDRYYDSEEYLSHDDSSSSLFARLYRFARKLNIKSKYRLIDSFVNDGQILDVGAGNGELVKYLKEQHIEAQGYEPSAAARKAAYQKGVRLLDHLPTNNKSYYSVIQLFHVLEHVPNPSKYLNELHEMLTDDGYLIIALPNYKSWDAQFFGKYWAGYDVPRHLFHFSEEGIKTMTSKKFTLEKTKPMWLDSFYVSILSARYKKTPLSFIVGIFCGAFSNLVAIINSQPSSRIYIFKKTK